MENDLIRRSDAIDLCKMALDDDWEPEYAEARLTEIPAVDAVDVVHAYWIDIKGTDGKDYIMCSNCHHGQEITGVKNYCAVCGARMDGRREDGDA